MPRISHEGKERQMPRLRSLSAGMLVLLLAGILAACGGGAPEAQQPTAVSAAQATAAPAAAEPTAAAAAADQPTAAPAAAEPTAAAPATGGGILSIGRTATPDSLNPGVAYLTQAFEIMQL